MKRAHAFLATAAALAGLASCSNDTASPSDDSAATTEMPSDQGQPAIDWDDCGQRFECGELEVPVDHGDPDGDTIDLALIRRPAEGPGERIGSLIMNPGGPGGSGLDFLRAFAPMAPPEVAARFDLVSFDPRGVGESDGYRCLDDEAMEAGNLEDGSPDTPAEVETLFEDHAHFVDGCEDAGGELLRNMSTADVAEDLDLMRAALGDEQLTFVGFSYGTRIGAAYATLFPDNVRALVLDGAVAPSSTSFEETRVQGVGFERVFDEFAAACNTDPTCPVAPDAAGRFDQIRAELEQQPVTVTDYVGEERLLTATLFELGVGTALYDESRWRMAAEGIASIADGDGSTIFLLADSQLGRNPDGTWTNQRDAQASVNCADAQDRPTREEVEGFAAELPAELPRWGSLFGWFAGSCLGWPEPENPLPELTGAGAPPILVVGTVGDPATPYEWAEEMAEALESAVLLTWEGSGHTAYPGTQCIVDAVNRYLIDLEPPEPGTRCEAGEAIAPTAEALRDQFVAAVMEQGLDEENADCIFDALEEAFDLDELDEVLSATEVDDEVNALITEAMMSC